MDMHSRSPKLMDRVKATMRVKRYSPRTEQTDCYWIRFFIRFHGVRHSVSMGEPQVHAFWSTWRSSVMSQRSPITRH